MISGGTTMAKETHTVEMSHVARVVFDGFLDLFGRLDRFDSEEFDLEGEAMESPNNENRLRIVEMAELEKSFADSPASSADFSFYSDYVSMSRDSQDSLNRGGTKGSQETPCSSPKEFTAKSETNVSESLPVSVITSKDSQDSLNRGGSKGSQEASRYSPEEFTVKSETNVSESLPACVSMSKGSQDSLNHEGTKGSQETLRYSPKEFIAKSETNVSESLRQSMSSSDKEAKLEARETEHHRGRSSDVDSLISRRSVGDVGASQDSLGSRDKCLIPTPPEYEHLPHSVDSTGEDSRDLSSLAFENMIEDVWQRSGSFLPGGTREASCPTSAKGSSSQKEPKSPGVSIASDSFMDELKKKIDFFATKRTEPAKFPSLSEDDRHEEASGREADCILPTREGNREPGTGRDNLGGTVHESRRELKTNTSASSVTSTVMDKGKEIIVMPILHNPGSTLCDDPMQDEGDHEDDPKSPSDPKKMTKSKVTTTSAVEVPTSTRHNEKSIKKERFRTLFFRRPAPTGTAKAARKVATTKTNSIPLFVRYPNTDKEESRVGHARAESKRRRKERKARLSQTLF